MSNIVACAHIRCLFLLLLLHIFFLFLLHVSPSLFLDTIIWGPGKPWFCYVVQYDFYFLASTFQVLELYAGTLHQSFVCFYLRDVTQVFLTIHIIFIFYYCCVLYYGYFNIMNSSPLLCNLPVHLHLFVFLFVDCLLPPEDFTYLFIAFCCLCFEGAWLRPMWKNVFSIWDMYSGLSTYVKWPIKSKTRIMYMGKEGI